MEPVEVRLDVWVWSVRFFKSRAAATAACKGGHVSVNGRKGKPATPVHVGTKITALTPSGLRIAVVQRLIEKRVGAPAAALCFEDLSPPPPPKEETVVVAVRDRGAGRPTKRDRRDLERLRNIR